MPFDHTLGFERHHVEHQIESDHIPHRRIRFRGGDDRFTAFTGQLDVVVAVVGEVDLQGRSPHFTVVDPHQRSGRRA